MKPLQEVELRRIMGGAAIIDPNYQDPLAYDPWKLDPESSRLMLLESMKWYPPYDNFVYRGSPY